MYLCQNNINLNLIKSQELYTIMSLPHELMFYRELKLILLIQNQLALH